MHAYLGSWTERQINLNSFRENSLPSYACLEWTPFLHHAESHVIIIASRVHFFATLASAWFSVLIDWREWNHALVPHDAPTGHLQDSLFNFHAQLKWMP